MKITFFTAMFCLTFLSLNAQNYTTAIGLKGGAYGRGYGGINLKHFFSGSTAIDATLGGGNNHLNASVLIEWQKPTGITPGLDWYIGVGGNLGLWSNSWNTPNNKYNYNSGLYLGALAVLGIEYTISEIPLNIALDLGPHLGLINAPRFGFGSALALRYYF